MHRETDVWKVREIDTEEAWETRFTQTHLCMRKYTRPSCLVHPYPPPISPLAPSFPIGSFASHPYQHQSTQSSVHTSKSTTRQLQRERGRTNTSNYGKVFEATAEFPFNGLWGGAALPPRDWGLRTTYEYLIDTFLIVITCLNNNARGWSLTFGQSAIMCGSREMSKCFFFVFCF